MKRILILLLRTILPAMIMAQQFQSPILTDIRSHSSALQQKAASDNSTYLNPVLGGDYPDPTIVRVGNDYYMTHSSFHRMPGLTVLHSIDLLHWEPVSFALTQNLGSVWAPDICYYQGKYYIYFTVSQGNDDFSTYVVTTTNPRGSWSNPVNLNVGGWIDPCHAVDKTMGQRWMFLSGGHRIRLSDDGLSTTGHLEKVYDGWEYPDDWVTEGKALEGPKIRQIGNYYYWLNAQGGTAGAPTSHMVIVARSQSLDGPWENAPNNPIIHTYSGEERWWSKGHGSLIDTPDGKWYVAYHAYEKGFLNNGRQTLMEPVEINDAEWIEAPTGDKVDLPLPAPIQAHTPSKSNCLNNFRIGLDWKFYGDYQPDRFVVEKSCLAMKGKGDNLGTSAPLLFTTGSHKYEMTVKVVLDDKTTAGLVLYYNENLFVGLGCDLDMVYRWRRGIKRKMHRHQGKQTLWLKLCMDHNIVSGSYSLDGKHWIKEKLGMEVGGYNHNTLDGFQSLMPGVFVYGDGKAIFSEFNYKECF